MIELVLPKWGLTMEAEVLEWLKREGDLITASEPLVVVETDKANAEVEAPVSGRLTRIVASVGAVVAPGDVLGEIEVE